MEMTSQVDEDILVILIGSSLEAKINGWKCLLGLTSTENGLTHIIQFKKYIPFMLSCIEQDNLEKEVHELIYKCTINIANTERGASEILIANKDFLVYLLGQISNASEYSNTEQKCCILNNLCAHKLILGQVIDILNDADDLLHKMIKQFCSINSVIRHECNFLALVFGNLTLLSKGRRLFLRKDCNFLQNLLCFLHIDEPEERRIGVAITVKNCCFEKDDHEWLLNELKILPSLLLPLIGPEEFEDEEMEKLPLECQYLGSTKERDPCNSVRKILVEAISWLCNTENGWNYLKSKGVYFVVRDHHLWEKDPDVIEALETLAAYLLVDQYAPTDRAFIEEVSQQEILEINVNKDAPDFVL